MVVFVWEVDVDVEAGVVLGVVGVDASDVVIFDYHGVKALRCRAEKKRVLQVLSSGWVVKVYGVR